MDVQAPQTYPAIRLLLVSSDHLLQLRLASWLGTQRDVTLAGYCATLAESTQIQTTSGANLLLVDVATADADDPEQWQALRDRYAPFPVIAIGEAAPESVAGGGHPASQTVWHLGSLDQEERFFASLRSAIDRIQIVHSYEAVLEKLSAQEVQVLNLVAGGLKNKEIAQRLNLSAYTVRNYLSTAYSKLGVTNRTEAVSRLHDLGAVPPQELPASLVAHK